MPFLSFEPTTMLLSVNHEIAPAEKAPGMGSNCGDWHATTCIDWPALGWSDDPMKGGKRTSSMPAQSASVILRPPLRTERGLE